jgi:hypothetical protein
MENQKSKIYLIIFAAMILFAIVLSVTRKVNTPVIYNSEETQQQVGQGVNTGILGNESDLVFLSIVPNVKVAGILNLTGEIKGGYFFEGNILINVLDVNKNVLKQGYGIATTEWMTAGPVSFTTSVDFTGLSAGPAYLEIHNDNASGLPENDKSILVPVIIE